MNHPIAYASIAIVAGMGIPLMAALNGKLGSLIGVQAAAASLFVVGLVASVAIAAVAGMPSNEQIAQVKPHYFLGGLLVAFYIFTISWAGPRFGVGNAVFCVLLGQLISAALVDHYGLVGSETPITLQRILGIAVMAVGLALALKR